jgi:tetraacyldisaccharide 4'-kinase
MREPAFWWQPVTIQSQLLAPFERCYASIAARRMLNSGARISVPVLCVGNFTMGGNGKTPTALELAKLLNATGETVFFLSRGYGGKLVGPHRVNEQTDRSKQVGDEALLLVRIAPTIIARDRVAGATLAVKQGASIVIMDDGLQNPSLEKDFVLAVVDGRRGVGNGKIFPAGPLRAPMDIQLRRADAILVIGKAEGARTVITAAKACGLPVFYGDLMPDMDKLADLKTRKVLAFAGIGDPEKFFKTAKIAGFSLAECRAFPDHHYFTAKEAAELTALAERQDLTLLTTEKDHARMIGIPFLRELATRSHVLPVTLVLKQKNQLHNFLLTKVRH